MKIIPLGNSVLIEPMDAEETKTSSGIILPEQVSDTDVTRIGRVLAIGEECKKDHIKVGDVIIYNRYSGDDITRLENGKKKVYRVLYDESVFCRIEE